MAVLQFKAQLFQGGVVRKCNGWGRI